MHRPPPGPSIGLSMVNIGPKMSYLKDNRSPDPLPQQLRLGLAWNIIDTDIIGFIVSSDLRKLLVHINDDGSSDEFYKAWFTSWGKKEFDCIIYSFGAEISIMTFFSLQAGRYIDEDGEVKYWTFGLSLGPEALRFNLAWYFTEELSPLEDAFFIGASFSIKITSFGLS